MSSPPKIAIAFVDTWQEWQDAGVPSYIEIEGPTTTEVVGIYQCALRSSKGRNLVMRVTSGLTCVLLILLLFANVQSIPISRLKVIKFGKLIDGTGKVL